MPRYIDADAFERAVMFSDDEDLQDVIYRLRDFPTADVVERKSGEWIHIKKKLMRGGYVDASECNICGKRIMPHLKPNFCPNCGAEMVKGETDE